MDGYSKLTAEESALVEFALGMFYFEGRRRGIPINVKGPLADVAEARVIEQLSQWLIESRPK